MITWVVLAMFGAILAGTPALLIYWMNEPQPVNYAKREILTPRVAPGEKLRIKIEASISKNDCKQTTYRSIIDSFNVVFFVEPESTFSWTNRILELDVPLGAAPGKAYYRAKVEWHCNPIQEHFPNTVLYPELDFEILPVVGQAQNPMKQGAYEKPGPAQSGTVE